VRPDFTVLCRKKAPAGVTELMLLTYWCMDSEGALDVDFGGRPRRAIRSRCVTEVHALQLVSNLQMRSY